MLDAGVSFAQDVPKRIVLDFIDNSRFGPAVVLEFGERPDRVLMVQDRPVFRERRVGLADDEGLLVENLIDCRPVEVAVLERPATFGVDLRVVEEKEQRSMTPFTLTIGYLT